MLGGSNPQPFARPSLHGPLGSRPQRRVLGERVAAIPCFLSAIAPDIPLSPGRFPIEQWLSREAGLISMARNALKKQGMAATLSPKTRLCGRDPNGP